MGDDIIATKWIGIEGTSIVAREKEEELLNRFSRSFVETVKSFDQYLSVVPEAAVAVKHGVSAMHDVTEGGIYGALWEMAEASGIGLEVDLKSIPIRQETVELCEAFRLNPYLLISSGCMLMAAPDGHGAGQRAGKRRDSCGRDRSFCRRKSEKNPERGGYCLPGKTKDR